MQQELTLAATTENLDEVLRLVTATAMECGLTDARTNEIQVAAEEAYINIVNHAYETSGDCTAQCRVEGDAVVLTLIDSGPPFDPVAAADPDTEMDVADRPIGGLGILLIKKLMDEVSYRRENDQNILVMTAREREKTER